MHCLCLTNDTKLTTLLRPNPLKLKTKQNKTSILQKVLDNWFKLISMDIFTIDYEIKYFKEENIY